MAQGVSSNLPLRAGASITRWVSLSRVHAHIRVHKHSHGCLQTLGLRYTHIATINNILSHAIMRFMHTMKWDYHN